jgi:hypothetical protein
MPECRSYLGTARSADKSTRLDLSKIVRPRDYPITVGPAWACAGPFCHLDFTKMRKHGSVSWVCRRMAIPPYPPNRLSGGTCFGSAERGVGNSGLSHFVDPACCRYRLAIASTRRLGLPNPGRRRKTRPRQRKLSGPLRSECCAILRLCCAILRLSISFSVLRQLHVQRI